jgi:hypothetical protein
MDILVSATQRAAMPSSHPGGGVLYASTSVGGADARALPFWIDASKGDGSDDNLLQKIRNQVQLTYEQSGPSARQKC